MKLNKIIILLLISLGLFFSCDELEVTHPTNISIDRAIETPEDLQTMLLSISTNTFKGYQKWASGLGAQVSLAMHHDRIDGQWWGYFQQNIIGYPQIGAINNLEQGTGPYGYGDTWAAFAFNFFDLNKSFALAGDIHKGLKKGVVLNIPGYTKETGTDLFNAYFNFLLGMNHGYGSLIYDRFFENNLDYDFFVDGIEKAPKPEEYTKPLAKAMEQLAKAIELVEKHPEVKSFPDNWWPYNPLTTADFLKICYFMRAKLTVYSARTIAQREAVDWTKVIADLEKADFANNIMQSLRPVSGGNGVIETGNWIWYCNAGSGESWRRQIGWINYFYLCEYSDVMTNKTDFTNWVSALDKGQVPEPFWIKTPDKRIWSGEAPTVSSNPAYGPENTGVLFGPRFNKTNNTWVTAFSPKAEYLKGLTNSHYAYLGHDYLRDANWTTKNTIFAKIAEKDLLLAEAYFRKGNKAKAAELINKTRVKAGLPASSAGETTESLWKKLVYEKRMECFDAYTMWFDGRGWGQLLKGSPLHFPIGAADLMSLGIPIYTTGGNNKPGVDSSTGKVAYVPNI